MAISTKHKFQSAKTDGADAGLIRPSNWNDDHDLTLATNRIIGRTTAGAGVAEEIAPGFHIDLSSGTINLKDAATAVAASNIDCSLGYYFSKTAAAAITWTVSNVPSGSKFYHLILRLTNGGAFTQTWWSSIKWPGGTAPTLTASGIDILGFYTDDGGTTWRGVMMMKDSK